MDLSGRHRKSILRAYLTTLFNYGGTMITVELLQTEWALIQWLTRQTIGIHARANIILKVMKAIGIPHHDCSPNHLWNQLCGVVAVPTNLQFFFVIWSGVPGAVLMSPNAIASFSLWWHKWNTFSSSSTSYNTNLVYSLYPASSMSPDNFFSSARISTIWAWSWSSTMNLCTSLFTSIQVQPGCFFTPLSVLCCSTSSARCCLPAEA